jgi:adenosylcobinamide kinase / adenosylcobinamide-phosphate guanylyltransferase
MRARISEHQARRGSGWITIEAPIDLAGALATAEERPVLVDCLTLWLTNLMLVGHDIGAAATAFEAALNRRRASTVLVSSEVGLGIVPSTSLGRIFRDEAGLLHQHIAARADRVSLMVAGLALKVK